MKILKCFFLVIVMNIVFITGVNAECSYKERKDLLDKAKNIEAFFEPDINNNRFNFYLYNLDNDLYVELYNPSNDMKKEIYKYQYDTEFYSYNELNVDNAINFKLSIYSNKSECYGDIVTSKTIKKGIINKFYKDDICKGIEDYKYCVPVLNNKFNTSDEEIINRINQYKNSLLVTEEVVIEDKFGLDDVVSLLKNYWYIPVGVLIICLVIFIIIYINKKRGEL